MNSSEAREKIENLRGIEKRFYEMLPEECWMTEQTMADDLCVGRTKIRNLKWSMINAGLLELEELGNGKRKNLKHKLWKAYPIILCEEGEAYQRYELDDQYQVEREINWSLIQEHTAQDINQMSKLEKIELYLEAGLIVLPTAYPVFTPNGVVCSCRKGADCPSTGKHPVVSYKYIDGYNYDKLKHGYQKQFKANPDLNIGFKVMGFSVLDVDYKHGGDLTLAELKHNYDVTMKGVLSVASGNGMHIYALNKDLKNTASVIGQGLDIRSENGFIMGAGSLHKNGTTYKWNEIGEVTDIPDDWIDESNDEILRGKRFNSRNVNVKKDIKLPRKLYPEYRILKGTRELTLFKWACRERGNGAGESTLRNVLTFIRDRHCEEPETVADAEINEVADDVVKSYAAGRRRYK